MAERTSSLFHLKHLISYLLEKEYSVVNADIVLLLMYGVDNINLREMDKYNSILSSKKIRDILGFKPVHDWNNYFKLF